jgi:hypothetical protein
VKGYNLNLIKAFARNNKIFLNWNKMLLENGTKGAERESFTKRGRVALP